MNFRIVPTMRIFTSTVEHKVAGSTPLRFRASLVLKNTASHKAVNKIRLRQQPKCIEIYVCRIKCDNCRRAISVYESYLLLSHSRRWWWRFWCVWRSRTRRGRRRYKNVYSSCVYYDIKVFVGVAKGQKHTIKYWMSVSIVVYGWCNNGTECFLLRKESA